MASNILCFQEQLDEVKISCYKDNFNFDIHRGIIILVDIIKKATPMVKKVTSICKKCETIISELIY